MKKTYIAPNFLLVNINCRSFVAMSTMGKYSDGGDNEVLVKENYPPISDKNVWDDEW